MKAIAARAVLLLVALVLCARTVRAGDPRLDYFTVETPHYRIHYHGGLEAVAQRTASLAEAIRERLAPPLSHAPDETTHILLVDATDSANGSASAIPYNAIRLFVTAPEDLSVLGDYDDWMTTLVTHEQAHVFHIDNITGVPALLNVLLGKTYGPNQVQPRWILEGLAVAMESRLTSGGRLRSTMFDMFLRADVLDDRIVPLDQMSHGPRRWPFGNIWYLYGGKFIGWILDTYGEDTFGAVSTDYGNNVLGWGINRSIRRATGRTYTELYEGWVASLREHYGRQMAEVRRRGLREGVQLTHTGQTLANPRFVPRCGRASDREELLFFRDDGHTLSGFYRLPLASRRRADEDEATLVARAVGSVRTASFDRECGFVFDHVGRSDRFYYFDDLYRQPPGTTSALGQRGARERWTTGLRARTPDVSPSGSQITFVTNHAGTTTLRIADVLPEGGIDRMRALLPSAPDEQAFLPRFSPDGRSIAYSALTRGGHRDVRVVDVSSGRFYELTHDRAMDAQPSWSPDGRYVVWSSDRTGIANIYAYEIATGAIHQVTNVRTGAYMPEISPDGRTLVYVGYTSRGFDLFSMPFDESRWLPASPPASRPDPPPEPPPRVWPIAPYSPLSTLRPYRYDLQYGPGLFGDYLTVSVTGADIAGLHGFGASLTYNTGIDAFTGSVGYSYNRLPVGLGTSAFRALVPRNPYVVDGRSHPVREEILGATSGISFSTGDDFTSQSVSIAYTASAHEAIYESDRTLDPYASVRDRPRDLFLGSVHLGWSYSTAYSTSFAVSREGGYVLSAGYDYAGPATGGQGTLSAINVRAAAYWLAPWLRHHAFAVALAGGAAGGSYPRGGYFFGGFAEQDVLEAITSGLRQSSFVVRGYPPGAFVGSQYNLANLEYRFPIGWIDHGISTLPLYLHGLTGVFFADYGGAYDELDLNDPLSQYHLGVGAEVRLGLTVGYFLSSSLRFGWAKGFDNLAVPGSQTYLVVAGSF